MTSKERKIMFVHSVLCRVYDDLNNTMRFIKNDPKDEDEEFIPARTALINAYLAVEKAHSEFEHLADKYTYWEDE